MIPQTFITDLLNRVDIVDIVGRYVQLKKGGANFMGLCPFHNEKSPSFTVSPTKQFYHCFGCGAHGDVISFLMELEHTTFMETVERLASRVGVELH
ncbi:DNA primase, partial [Acinetobacter baumannii]|nr:DNA primase [Acinetobacter baumannii]